MNGQQRLRCLTAPCLRSTALCCIRLSAQWTSQVVSPAPSAGCSILRQWVDKPHLPKDEAASCSKHDHGPRVSHVELFSSPAVLTLSCHWTQIGRDERVRHDLPRRDRSRRLKQTLHSSGVGEPKTTAVKLALALQWVNKLSRLPQSFNDRIMTMKLTLTGKNKATIISAYEPTMTSPDDIKDQFYEERNSLMTAVPKAEKLIILGDFNARVGVDHQSWENVLGKNGIGRCNSNGLLLLQLCAEQELLVTIQCSASLPVTGRHGCTPGLSTGTLSTISSSGKEIDRTSE